MTIANPLFEGFKTMVGLSRALLILLSGLWTTSLQAQDQTPSFQWNAPTQPPSGTLIAQDKARGMVWLLDLRNQKAVLLELPFNSGNHDTALSPDGRSFVTGHYETIPKGGAPLSGIPGDEVSLVDLGTRTSRVYPTIASPKPATRSHGVLWLGDGRLAVTAELANAIVIYPPPGGSGSAQVFELGETGCRTPHMLRQIPGSTLLFVTCRATNPGDKAETPGYFVAIDLATGAKRALLSGIGAEGMTITPSNEIWVGNYREDTVSIFGFENNTIRLDALTLKNKMPVPKPMRLVYEPSTDSVGVTTTDAMVQVNKPNFRVFDAKTYKLKNQARLVSASRDEIISHGLASIPGFFILGGVNNQALLIVAASDLSVQGEVLLPRCSGGRADQNKKCELTMRNPNDATPTMPDGFAWSPLVMAQ